LFLPCLIGKTNAHHTCIILNEKTSGVAARSGDGFVLEKAVALE
jgi:hypothetical protein